MTDRLADLAPPLQALLAGVRVARAVGVPGAAAVASASLWLPYALAFAAGAMIYVVFEELIPAAHQEDRGDLATLAALAGFTLMMILDVSLG